MKTIPKLIKFIKSNQEDVVILIAVALVTLISFNAGRIYSSAQLKKSLIIERPADVATGVEPDSKANPDEALDLRVVASKASTSKKYHFLWCPGAQKIKESNKIYFESEQEAQSRGYTLAGNCQK